MVTLTYKYTGGEGRVSTYRSFLFSEEMEQKLLAIMKKKGYPKKPVSEHDIIKEALELYYKTVVKKKEVKKE